MLYLYRIKSRNYPSWLLFKFCTCRLYGKVYKNIWFFRRECPTCKQRLTGRMLHYLNAYFTGEGELVKELLIHKIPIIKLPINDQICFRIYTKYLTLSILACKPNNVGEDHFFQTAFIDINDHIVMSSIKQFSKNKIYDLIDYIQNINVNN